MKKAFWLLNILSCLLFWQSCTKTESDLSEKERLTLSASSLSVVEGTSVAFTIVSSKDNADVTGSSQLFVNGSSVAASNYAFSSVGTYSVYATHAGITSNNVTISVVAKPFESFKHHVLVEEFSGTWCGNCPNILYAIDLVKQQTQEAYVVGIHLYNDDPFIVPVEGEYLGNLNNTGPGLPVGKINGTISWKGPQYDNVPQVINEIKPFASAGLAISSALTPATLNATVRFAYKDAAATGTKLMVYLVEDSLFYTQRNYSSSLYGGQPYIPNFMYNGVLRKVISSLDGDVVANSGMANEKTYSINLPSNIANINHVRLVAFIKDAAGNVINVQRAKVGTVNDFENL